MDRQGESVHWERLFQTERILGGLSRKILGIRHRDSYYFWMECIRDISVFIQADRSFFFLCDRAKKKMKKRSEWIQGNASGSLPMELPVTSPILSYLSRERFYYGRESESFPGLTFEEKEVFLRVEDPNLYRIQSVLILPILDGNELIGIIGFGTSNAELTWREEDYQLLSIFSDMLAMSLENRRYQKELAEKEKSLREYCNRINEDLELARYTQKTLVSLDFPKIDSMKTAIYFHPYEKIGGDVISYYKHSEYIDILFADVSGHGISAAMVSGMVILSFQNSSRLEEYPKNILSNVNRDLKQIVINHHISAVSVRICPVKKKLRYSYAGHPPLALIRNQRVIELDGMNTPLLTLDNIEYFDQDQSLESGDRVVFFSDGCFEVFNENQEFLGLQNLYTILEKESGETDVDLFRERVVRDIMDYCHNDIRDDLTLLVLDIA